MKKSMRVTAILLVLCMCSALAGCGKKDAGNAKNSKPVKVESDCDYFCPGAGFGFDLPENMKLSNGFIEIKDIGDIDYDSGVMMGWPTYYDMTEEEYYGSNSETLGSLLHAGTSFNVMCVEGVNSEEEAKNKMLATLEKMYGKVSDEDRQSVVDYKMLHQENGYVWLWKMDDRATGLRDKSTEEYNAFYDASEEILNNLKYYTPNVWTGTEEGTALSFETIDLEGNPVKSESLFANNKVTMINIWATTCGPCIEEMPELEEMNKEFQAKGGAIVGLVDDVWVNNTKYLDEAKAIVSDTGVTYTNLCAWDGFDDMLEAVGTPTTYFVDSQGKILGDAVLGANPAKYKELMDKYLSQAK